MDGKADIRSYFPSRKTQLSSAKRDVGKKLASTGTPKRQPVPLTGSLAEPAGPPKVQKKPDARPVDKNVVKTAKDDVPAPSSLLLSKKIASTTVKKPIANVQQQKKTKTMTLIEFQRFRQKAAADAVKEFHNSCDQLQKTPEKLQLSPFYSSHKDLTTAQASANLRHVHARRHLSFTAPAGSIKRPTCPASDLLKVGPIDWELEATSSVGPATKHFASPPKLPSSDVVIMPPRTPIKNIFSPVKLVDPAVLPPRTPGKTPRKDVVGDRMGLMLSPGKKMSLFSPQKGHVYQSVRTAAQVHADAVSKEISVVSSADRSDDAEERGLKRKADPQLNMAKRRLNELKELKAKAQGVAEKRAGLLHGLAAGQPPASERFAHLIKPTAPAPVGPQLPVKFRQLEDMFQKVDMVATIHANRSEVSCFEKLPLPSNTDLALINHFFPKAFNIRVQKISDHRACPASILRPNVTEHYVLCINDDKQESLVPDELLISVKLTPEDRVRRQKKFHEVLLNYVHDQHAQFVRTLDPPLVIDDWKKVTNWHDQFPVNDLDFPVPNPLPEFSKPLTARTFEHVLKTAGDVIARRREPLFKRNVPTEKGKKDCLEEPKEPAIVIDEKIFSHPAFKNMDEATRIRIREAEVRKQMNSVIKDPVVEHRRKRLGMMVQMGKIVNNAFPKDSHVLSQEDMLRTLKSSLGKALTPDELKDHFDLFIEVFSKAGWLKLRWAGKCYIHDLRRQRDKEIFGIVDMENVVQEEYARIENDMKLSG